jgi:MinD superfamily P-loop ATPase
MRIAILSGKGGTGKTTLSVNLFHLLQDAILIDTDVEEPNAHLFMTNTTYDLFEVTKEYPVVDPLKCTMCNACGDHCNFNAIIPAKNQVLVFADLCHDCGFCELVCPDHAIHYEQKGIGDIYQSNNSDHILLYGKLHIGEVSGVKLIEKMNQMTTNEKLVLVDCPPGVSCSTVQGVDGSDYAIIVAEPTPFGLSDMKMVIELLQDLSIPFGIVINKSGLGNNELKKYIQSNDFPLLAEIPWSKQRATMYSKGEIIVHKDPVMKKKLIDITQKAGIYYGI